MDTARLAAALAPCCLVVEDSDLINHGFGDSNWLAIALVASNKGAADHVITTVYVPSKLAMQAVSALAKQIGRLPSWAKVLLLIAACGCTDWWSREGRPKRHHDGVQRVGREFVRSTGPTLAFLAEQMTEAPEEWERHVVTASPGRSLSEQIAAVLARSNHAMLAGDVAAALGYKGRPQGVATPVVRAQLTRSPAFTPVTAWRFELGYQVGQTASPVLEPEIMSEHFEWWSRLVALADERASESA